MSDPLPLIGPDGKEYVLTNPDALEQLRAEGFQLPSEPAAPSGLGREPGPETPVESSIESFKAGTQGLMRGLTGGLSDAALAGLGGGNERVGPQGQAESYTQEAKRLAEENPVASGVGEFAGMLASPINEAGNAVRGTLGATTAIGRIAASTAGGATSGLLFGAGKAVSDAALGDVDLTAEKLIAGGGLGMLLGGVGGGVGGAIEEGARAVLPKIKTLAARAQSALDDIANDATISSTRAQQNIINKIGDEKLPEVARTLRERGHLELSPEKMLESVSRDREALGKTLGKVLDDLDAAGAKPQHMEFLKRLDDFEAKLNPIQQDAIAGDLSAARKAIAKLGANDEGFRALDSVKRTIQDKAKFSRGPVPLDDVTMGLKRQISGIVRDELDQQILPKLGADAGKAFTEAKATYGALKDAERLAESGVSRVGERGALSYIGLKDLLAGNLVGGGHPFGIAGMLGSKVLREHGAAIVARIADKLAKEPALAAMAKSFAAQLPAVAPRLGQYGAVLAQEAAISPERALAAHMAHAQLDPGYAAHAQLAGLTPETPAEQPAAMGRAQSIAEAAAAAKAHDEEMRKGIERVFKNEGAPKASSALKSQDFGSMRMRRDERASYDKRVDEVRELAANPEALVERLTRNMAGVGQTAPNMAAAMTNAAHRAVSYLAQQAEVPPKAGPLAPEWDVPEADRFSFSQKLEVVQEPMSVLRAAASGTLTEDQIDALRAVYPRLARQMTDMTLERMTTAKGDVPYRARLMLSMLSGLDVDGTMSPEAIAANQTAISKSGQKSAAPGAPGESKDAGSITLAQRMSLPGQRREVTRDEAG